MSLFIWLLCSETDRIIAFCNNQEGIKSHYIISEPSCLKVKQSCVCSVYDLSNKTSIMWSSLTRMCGCCFWSAWEKRCIDECMYCIYVCMYALKCSCTCTYSEINKTVTLLLDWSQLTGLMCNCCVKRCVPLSQSSRFPPVICQANKTLAGITPTSVNQPYMQISMLVQQVRLVEELLGLAGVVDVCKIHVQGFSYSHDLLQVFVRGAAKKNKFVRLASCQSCSICEARKAETTT